MKDTPLARALRDVHQRMTGCELPGCAACATNYALLAALVNEASRASPIHCTPQEIQETVS